jgi:site-specific DNA recombinase
VVRRVPAAEIEAAVLDQLRDLLRTPEIIVATWRGAKAEQGGITEAQAREALLDLDPLWDELFPAEQTRILQLLVERVEVRLDGLEIKLKIDGLSTLVHELRTEKPARRAA